MLELQEDLILEEVAPDRQLVQEMEKYLPHSYQTLSMVLLNLRYQHFPLMGARLYTPQCGLYRYKMVVITNIATADVMSSMSMYWSKDHLSDGVVCQLFRSLPGVNWTGPIFIRQIPIDLHHNMDRIISELSQGSLAAKMALPVIIFVWRNGAPTVPSLPDGYYAGPLKEIHGRRVLTGWVGSFAENGKAFSRILHHLPSVGIFKKRKSSSKLLEIPRKTNGIETAKNSNPILELTAESDGQKTTSGKNNIVFSSPGSDESTFELDGSADASRPASAKGTDRVCSSNGKTVDLRDELVGWCCLKPGADIGMTYTTKGHRNLGMAKVSTLELVRQALDEKVSVFILSTMDNKVSIAMHTKLGFEKYSTDMILMYAPKEYNVDHIAESVRC